MPDDVRWIRSYVLAEQDGSVGTVCIYQATSPEAIRAHAQAAPPARRRDRRGRRHRDRPARPAGGGGMTARTRLVLLSPCPGPRGAGWRRSRRRLDGGKPPRPVPRPRQGDRGGLRLPPARPGGDLHRSRAKADGRCTWSTCRCCSTARSTRDQPELLVYESPNTVRSSSSRSSTSSSRRTGRFRAAGAVRPEFDLVGAGEPLRPAAVLRAARVDLEAETRAAS